MRSDKEMKEIRDNIKENKTVNKIDTIMDNIDKDIIKDEEGNSDNDSMNLDLNEKQKSKLKYIILSAILIILIGTILAIVFTYINNVRKGEVKSVDVTYINDNKEYNIPENYIKKFSSKDATGDIKKKLKSSVIIYYIYPDGKLIKKRNESTALASIERIYEFKIDNIGDLNSFDDVYNKLEGMDEIAVFGKNITKEFRY